jgi:cellulose synthase/poly-beta-1,6-N-acetylglucosamine synthase-like glycosyltransferase
LLNKLELDYPSEKFEIIVISDSSNDETDDVVRQYGQHSVKLLRQKIRAGKTAALNMAVPQAKGEILFFSDANSIWSQDAIIKMVHNFNDPSVGYVTGKMIYTNPDGSTIGDGCSAYMKYENMLRRIETRSGSIVGVDGGIDAVRKELYYPMNPDQLPDFVLPLKVVEQGYRVVYEPEAILKEAALKTSEDEYRMRVRVSLRALWALWEMRNLLTCKVSMLFAWQLWSHKVLRYLCFVFLVGAYFANLSLWRENDFYMFFFVIQNIAYLGVVMYPVIKKSGRRFKPLYYFSYFALLNLASAHAFIKFIFGQKQVMWTPRKGI